MPAPQQSGILCNDLRFQQFLGAKIVKSGVTLNPTACAEYIRQHCNIKSRRDLITNPTAHAKFQALRTEFDVWIGRIGKPRI